MSQKKYSLNLISESYKALRTNIQYSEFDGTIKIILITSSIPGEGKSTTSINLALSLAQGEDKVLLIDADLRKPSIHKKMKISNLKGLSELLISKEQINTCTHSYNSNLDVIASGKIPPNPSEMIQSSSMDRLLESLKYKYKYIIIDSPPVQAVTDAKILSTKADGVLVVVKADSTKKTDAKSTCDELRKVNGKILGLILNCSDPKNNCYYYYN